jgi:hypothetical protein
MAMMSCSLSTTVGILTRYEVVIHSVYLYILFTMARMVHNIKEISSILHTNNDNTLY